MRYFGTSAIQMMLFMTLHLSVSALAAEDQRKESNAPSAWMNTCRNYMLAAVEDWNMHHSNDPLPAPRTTVKKTADKLGFPMIVVSQWFFQKTGSGTAQVTWREPWTTPLSDTIWPASTLTHKNGSQSFIIVRSTRKAPESGQWFPPGSMRGSVSTFAGDERDKKLMELFAPVVEACVRHLPRNGKKSETKALP